MYYIREASKYAEYLKKTSITGTPSFEVQQFVKYKAAMDAVLKTYVSKARIGGTKGKIGEVTFENTDRVDVFSGLLSMLKKEVKIWEDAIRGYGFAGFAKPVSTVKGSKPKTGNPFSSIVTSLNRGD